MSPVAEKCAQKAWRVTKLSARRSSVYCDSVVMAMPDVHCFASCAIGYRPLLQSLCVAAERVVVPCAVSVPAARESARPRSSHIG